ncbi:hypothetical protein RirG_024620 [Rhizophagus irregularis DAOM 197198w]|uniref:Uncharacterized protein n=1 Tax=Rhizophagus irregularis (strain DAOM 197198w) TaxID=1432141 RepID=A0A015LCB4_RHIIW|nr:hypothetical protein RirG_024620 [Rhizophagus irregularis DAOM 197198w]
MLTECINEIPTRNLPSVMDEYFPELNIVLKEYLTPQILQKQCDQMAQSLYYDAILIDDWLSLLEHELLQQHHIITMSNQVFL